MNATYKDFGNGTTDLFVDVVSTLALLSGESETGVADVCAACCAECDCTDKLFGTCGAFLQSEDLSDQDFDGRWGYPGCSVYEETVGMLW